MIQTKYIVSLFLVIGLSLNCGSSKRKSEVKGKEASFVDSVRINRTIAVFERLAEGRLSKDNYDKGVARDSVLPGTEEEEIISKFILDELLAAGISASIETFPVTTYRIMNSYLAVGGKKFTAITLGNSIGTYGTKSIFRYSLGNDKKKEKIVGELLSVGRGTKKDLDAFRDLENKILLIERSDDRTGWPTPVIEEARDRGVHAIIFYGYKGESFIKDALYLDATYSNDIPVLAISYEDAIRVQEILAAGKHNVEISSEVYVEEGIGRNVIGYIRGKNLPDEYIMLGVHYDKFFAGARNACSGVAGLLELAYALASGGYVNNRTIVIGFFSGHYAGVSGYIPAKFNGSFSYLEKHPEIYSRLLAYINLDEIGGIGKPKYLYSSYDLDEFAKKIITDLNLHDRYTQASGFPNVSDATPAILHGSAFLQFFTTNSVISFENTHYDTKKEVDKKNFGNELEAVALALGRLDQFGIHPFKISSISEYAIRALEENQKHLRWNLIDDLLDRLMLTKKLGNKLEQHIADTLLKVELSEFKNKKKFGDVASTSREYNNLLIETRQKFYTKIISILGDINAWRLGFFIDQYAEDLTYINSSLYALDSGDYHLISGFLEKVTTLGWGSHFSRDIYLRIMRSYHEKRPLWLTKSQTYNDPYLWDIWSVFSTTKTGSFTKERAFLSSVKESLQSKIQSELESLKPIIDERNQALKAFLESKGVELEGIAIH